MNDEFCVGAIMLDNRNDAMGEMARNIYSLGISLLQVGKIREAVFQFKKTLLIIPHYFDALIAIGHCLHLTGEYSEALSVYDHALIFSPERAEIWNNRGNTLLELSRFQEAAESYYHCLELAPSLHDARVAMATCFQALGRYNDAMAACDTVLAAAIDNAEAHWNRGLLLLLHGKYREGWLEYEWRWRKRGFTSPQRNFPQPIWGGEPAPGKTVLIHAEQGFGDTIQFCRYLPKVADRCSVVIFECHPPLAPLMKGMADNIFVAEMGAPLPPFDLHLPLLSLPLIFGTTLETLPMDVPYLKYPDSKNKNWQGQIIDSAGLKVGICWAGKSYPDPGRSCPVEILAQLADIQEVCWYSLQTGWTNALPFQMIDLTDDIHDFGDTASIMAQLDIVITVDTAVAHLAGALGKRVWLMLPYAPDWRWMLKRDDSTWYPTMRIFRQPAIFAWDYVVRQVAGSLKTEVIH